MLRALAPSVWAYLQRLLARSQRGDLGTNAAAVAFFGFLAVFPAIAAVVSIWGFVADPEIIRAEMMLVRDVLPAEAFLLLSEQVESLLASTSRQLGWTTAVSTAIAIWSARAGVAALLAGVNAVHDWPGRSGVHHLLLALLLTMALVAIALAALVAAVVVPVVLAFLPLGEMAALVLELANTGFALGLVSMGLALAYRFGPNRPVDHTPRMFTRGLLVALILWALVSRGFVIYLANFDSYNKVYGSIGAVVVLMMWFYLSAYAVLLGAAVDADVATQRREAAAKKADPSDHLVD